MIVPDPLRKSGIYGCFRLDGGPVEAGDAAALGLDTGTVARSAVAQGVDHHQPAAVQCRAVGAALTILVGQIEEAPALAARLGLAPAIPVADLALAALQRFGGETHAEMIGEWSLLHWDGARRLTLMQSAARRDRLLFAISGARVAVAPDIFPLARIPWIGAAMDEAGLLYALGRADLRGMAGDRTMLARVRQLEPGGSVTIEPGGARRTAAAVLVPQPRWTGSFDDAVAAAEELLRRIMRARLAHIARPAAMLSGGLDSSTLAWLAAEERGAGQDLLLMTSVAPPGSSRPDEAQFADLVAGRLGLTAMHLSPPHDANIYRPPLAVLTGASGPPLPSRHCLTETFQQTARAAGATAIIDGTFGEMTVTRKLPHRPTFRRLLRQMAGEARRRLVAARNRDDNRFHVRLAPHRLADLPDCIAARIAADAPAARDEGELWGYLPGAAKSLHQPNEFYGGAIRAEYPYRDLRLLRLFAGFPAAFATHDKVDRAPVRRMIQGHLPEAIRLRPSGLPASPDHLDRIRRQAPLARTRIADFRRAGVDDWLDLDWLDAALLRVGAQGAAGYVDANEVQMTAIVAEFLLWWRTQS